MTYIEKKIDLTPNWVDLLDEFFEWIQSGKSEQVERAKNELLKICSLADEINKILKDNDKVIIIEENGKIVIK